MELEACARKHQLMELEAQEAEKKTIMTMEKKKKKLNLRSRIIPNLCDFEREKTAKSLRAVMKAKQPYHET